MKNAPESQNPSQNIKAPSMNWERTHVKAFLSEALKFSAKHGFLLEGKQLHSQVVKLGCEYHQSLQNQLLNMYVKSGAVFDACRLFVRMPDRNVVSWNIMISGSVGYGRFLCRSTVEMAIKVTELCNLSFDNQSIRNEVSETLEKSLDFCEFSGHELALFFFKKMMVETVGPNYITFISSLNACRELNDIDGGIQMHCLIIKFGFSLNGFVGSALVDFYAKCCSAEDAYQVFNEIESKDLVLWNVMVSSYVLNGLGGEAFRIFESMRTGGVMGDEFTFCSLLNSCSILGSGELGKQMHCLIIRLSLDSDVLVASALVDMYAKNGNLEDACSAFEEMAIRNVVSWTTMIVGYGKNGEGKEAMKLFRQMLQVGLKPDDLALASLLSSCANLAAATEAIQLHAHVVKCGLEEFLSVGNALVSAYSRCGCIANAFKSFSLICKPDLVTWTSMIGACAFHGLAREAVEIFEKMLHEGVRPDRIAFVGVLSACSHAGLVDEGLHYFNLMRRDHHIVPDSEHYTCLVDLFGRAGHLDEAYNILINMPFEPGANVLGAFIGACKVHGEIKLAEWAAHMLLELEPDEAVNYAVMSNIYAAEGSWSEVARVRKMMRNRTNYKVPGCSWTEIGGQVHTFVSNDKSHPQVAEIYSILDILEEDLHL